MTVSKQLKRNPGPPIVQSVMQIAFFVSPIIWKPELIEHGRRFLPLNPFFALLEIVRAPAGDFTTATLRFVDELERRWPNTIVTIVIPELYVDHWWQHLLHNQSVLVLKGRLLFRANTAVTSIPYGVAEPELPSPY